MCSSQCEGAVLPRWLLLSVSTYPFTSYRSSSWMLSTNRHAGRLASSDRPPSCGNGEGTVAGQDADSLAPAAGAATTWEGGRAGATLGLDIHLHLSSLEGGIQQIDGFGDSYPLVPTCQLSSGFRGSRSLLCSFGSVLNRRNVRAASFNTLKTISNHRLAVHKYIPRQSSNNLRDLWMRSNDFEKP